MRYLIFIVILILLIPVGWLAAKKLDWDRILLPIRLVQLASQPVDETILMPVDRVRVADIADTWGAPRSGGRQHEGQDIFAETGTPIYSATEGYVVKVGQDNLGGKVVMIAGKGARYYYYAHLDQFAPDLEVGDRVTPDSLIGYVGNTGDAISTPPHLHFGIYHYSKALDPLPLLRNRE